MRSIASRCGRTASRSSVRPERRDARLVERGARSEEVERPAEDDDADVDALAALEPRHEPVDRIGEGATAAHGLARLPRRWSRRFEPLQEIFDVRAAVVAVEPLVGKGVRHVRRGPSRSARREPLVGRRIEPANGSSTCSRIAGNGRARAPGRARPRGGSRARRRGRSATAARATQQVRVLGGAVDVRHERVEPDDVGGELGGRRAADRRVKGSDPGRKSTPRFRPALATSSPGSRGRARRGRARGRARRARARGRGSPSARASSPATTSATSAFRPLPRAAELEDVEPVVVGLDERGQRAALAERRHVAGRGERPAAPTTPAPRVRRPSPRPWRQPSRERPRPRRARCSGSRAPQRRPQRGSSRAQPVARRAPARRARAKRRGGRWGARLAAHPARRRSHAGRRAP